MPTRLLALLLSVALLAAACGGGDDDASGDDTTTGAADVVSDDDAAVGDDAAATETSTTAAPLAPPTTRGPAPTLEVEPVSGIGSITVLSDEPAYRGLIGQLDADRNVVQAAALPPAPAAPGIAPLTGLPLADPTVADRPAIVAKIDNTAKGRPQDALSQADLVYVTEIEGGFTRLVPVWHSQTPTEIGPVRSGRTTDITIFSALSTPIFVWSGANRVHASLLRRYDMVDLGAATRSEYFRSPDRPGTYDLMTDPAVIWGIAAELGKGNAPQPQFEYRDDTIGLPPSAVPASSVRIDYPSTGVDWTWDAAAGGWRRAQGGTPHVDADGNEVLAANVVIAEVSRTSTGMVDTAGSAVNEQQFIGSGRGWVFTDGHAVEVTWTKPSLSSVPTWTTPDGVPVALVPGQTWVELTPSGASSFSG